MERHILIRHVGGLGNRMFQYMLAMALAARVPGAKVSGIDLPEWGIVIPQAEVPPGDILEVAGLHDFNLDRLAYALRTGLAAAIGLRGFAQRLEYYPDRAASGGLFTPPADAPDGFGDDVLVINIRADEIVTGKHRDYRPLPIAWYRRLIAESGLRPLFVGQTGGDDPYSRHLRAAFADAEFVPHRSPVGDFEMLRRSRHLVMSISSFSWLTCWFSTARTIHMPVAGLFDPRQRREVNLIPVGDGRYRYYEFGQGRWTGTNDELRSLVVPDAPVRELTAAEAARLVVL